MKRPAEAPLDKLGMLRNTLAALRDQFAGQPDLYRIYSQPTLFELKSLQEEIRSIMAESDPAVDLWVGLRGDAFGEGTGPADVVAPFLRTLRVGVRHAASAISGLPYTGGRFGKQVETATAFKLVATAPGSLQLGLAAPDLGFSAQLEPDVLDIGFITTAISAYADGRSLCIKATRTLIDALGAPTSDAILAKLRHDLGDDGTLRVLYYARSLFPNGVKSLEFHGSSLERSFEYDSSVRYGLRRIGDELVQTARYVSGSGILHMLDLDRNTLRLEFTRMDSFPGVENLNGEYDPRTGHVASLMGQPVEFSGWLTFDLAGEPGKIRVDSLGAAEPAAGESGQLSL